MHTSNGIQTHAPSVRAGENCSYFRQSDHCDRLKFATAVLYLQTYPWVRIHIKSIPPLLHAEAYILPPLAHVYVFQIEESFNLYPSACAPRNPRLVTPNLSLSSDKKHSYISINRRYSEWCNSEKCSLKQSNRLVPLSGVTGHPWSISLYTTQKTTVVAATHVHMNAGQWENPCGRRLLGHEAVELFVPSVPLDGIKWGMLQVVIAG
jgi:hypothetical protein